MGTKHGKYIYIERKDGWYIKVRVLNIRLKKKGKEKITFDTTDPTRYIVVGSKTRNPPIRAQIMKEDDVPEEVRKSIYGI